MNNSSLAWLSAILAISVVVCTWWTCDKVEKYGVQPTLHRVWYGPQDGGVP